MLTIYISDKYGELFSQKIQFNLMETYNEYEIQFTFHLPKSH